MNFLIDLFKKAKKGDSFRPNPASDKYNDKIAQLNSLGSNQYSRLDTNSLNKISKSTAELTPTTTQGSTLPGK